jgi:transposase-like protein
MYQLAKPWDFCHNERCDDYNKRNRGNIIKAGKTKAGVQRYECIACHQTFTETKGTLLYRKHTPMDKILEVLALLAEGNRVSSVTRVKGVKEDTILGWLREAAEHSGVLNDALLSDYHVQRGQLDGLWLFIQKKGQKKVFRKAM